MIMRNAVVLSALLLTACATGTQISQTAAHIPLPEITIIGHTDLSNVPTISRSVTASVPAHFEFRIQNQADIPITLRQIDLTSQGTPGIRIESKTRPFNTVIEPHTIQSVDFVTTADIPATNRVPAGPIPVQIRATALFDSSQGSLQKIVVQQLRPDSGE